MSARVLPIRSLAAAGLALVISQPSLAQIAAKSPFMPPQSAASAGPTAGAPLEFRGVIGSASGTLYRIYDPGKKVGVWVPLNERHSEFDVLVKQYDESQQTLVVEHQGKTLKLAERKAKVVSSGSAAAAVPPPVIAPVPSNVSPAVTQAVVLNPTPADEQRRLDAVAAEVARRRAMREQATQQITQGGAPQVNVPQAVQPQQPQGNIQPQGTVGIPRGPQTNQR
jgi:hypothetical protein